MLNNGFHKWRWWVGQIDWLLEKDRILPVENISVLKRRERRFQMHTLGVQNEHMSHMFNILTYFSVIKPYHWWFKRSVSAQLASIQLQLGIGFHPWFAQLTLSKLSQMFSGACLLHSINLQFDTTQNICSWHVINFLFHLDKIWKRINVRPGQLTNEQLAETLSF